MDGTMTDRKKLIEAIEEKANCVLLCLATSERENVPAQLDESYVVEAHGLLQKLTLKDDQSLGLVIYSRGGHAQVPLELVAMIREMFRKRRFIAFVPYRAYSAATVIALGADEIVMGPRGHLGPIDATIHGNPHSPRDDVVGTPLPVAVEEVRKYFELVKEMTGKSAQLELAAFQALADNVRPLALGAVQRTLKSTEHDAGVLLRLRLAKEPKEKSDKIVKNLASEVTFHGHAIFRTEARNLGIDFVKDSEDYGIQDELWELVEAYMDLFQVYTPFEARLKVEIDGDQETKEGGIPLGLLETRTDGKLCLIDYVCRKVQPPMPQLQLTANLEGAESVVTRLVEDIQSSLKHLEDPGSLPSADQIQGMVVGILQQSVQEWLKEAGPRAVHEALESVLPPSGIMEWARNRRWKKLESWAQ